MTDFWISVGVDPSSMLGVSKGCGASSLLEVGEAGNDRCEATNSGSSLTSLAVAIDSLSMFRCLTRS